MERHAYLAPHVLRRLRAGVPEVGHRPLAPAFMHIMVDSKAGVESGSFGERCAQGRVDCSLWRGAP